MHLEKVKYNYDNRNENVGRNKNSSGSNKLGRESQGFFIKPQIRFYNTNTISTTVTMDAHDFHPMNFDIMIWTLSIGNPDIKFGSRKWSFINHIPLLSKLGCKSKSKDASNCNVQFIIIDNHRTRNPVYHQLYWNRNPLPNRVESGTLRSENDSEEQQRTEYEDRLPRFYRGDLLRNPDSIYMPKDTHHEILLFFTFRDSNFLYLISRSNNAFNGDFAQFTIPMNREFRMNMKFSSNEYTLDISYRIISNSWDNIHIERIT